MELIYRGPSRLDGAPIIVVTSGDDVPSTNAKTGAMIQLYTLREDLSPSNAVASNEDTSICGDCPLRGSKRVCYVDHVRGPDKVYAKYLRLRNSRKGLTPLTKRERKAFGNRRSLRFGAYGEGVLLPIGYYEDLTSNADNFTCYTHLWQQSWVQEQGYQRFTQASVETEDQAYLAQALGFKTFRIKSATGRTLPNEVVCPYQTKGVQCIRCGLCNGNKANIVADVHGLSWKINNFINL